MAHPLRAEEEIVLNLPQPSPGSPDSASQPERTRAAGAASHDSTNRHLDRATQTESSRCQSDRLNAFAAIRIAPIFPGPATPPPTTPTWSGGPALRTNRVEVTADQPTLVVPIAPAAGLHTEPASVHGAELRPRLPAARLHLNRLTASPQDGVHAAPSAARELRFSAVHGYTVVPSAKADGYPILHIAGLPPPLIVSGAPPSGRNRRDTALDRASWRPMILSHRPHPSCSRRAAHNRRDAMVQSAGASPS